MPVHQLSFQQMPLYQMSNDLTNFCLLAQWLLIEVFMIKCQVVQFTYDQMPIWLMTKWLVNQITWDKLTSGDNVIKLVSFIAEDDAK
jgi:hypothetical protein